METLDEKIKIMIEETWFVEKGRYMPDTDKWLTKRALNLYLLTTQIQATIKHHITSTKAHKVNLEQFENSYFPITKFTLTQLILANLIQILNLFYNYLVFSMHNLKLEILGCDILS